MIVKYNEIKLKISESSKLSVLFLSVLRSALTQLLAVESYMFDSYLSSRRAHKDQTAQRHAELVVDPG